MRVLFKKYIFFTNNICVRYNIYTFLESLNLNFHLKLKVNALFLYNFSFYAFIILIRQLVSKALQKYF